jgi:hypothetical protein
MIGKYTASQVISPAGEFVYELKVGQGSSRIEADLLPFHQASITVTCSPDYAGAGTFAINEGNEKGGAIYPIGGATSLVLTAGATLGEFGIPITGRFLILKSTAFTITAGTATITIIGKR